MATGVRQREDRSVDRKINTIRFILLAIVLYIFSDSVGKWFIPDGFNVPGLWTALIWVICMACAATLFYGFHIIRNKSGRWLFCLLFYIIFIALLLICRFYSKEEDNLTGYRLSVSFMPLLGMLVESCLTRFIKWYGNLIKKVFHLSGIRSVTFALFMLIPIVLTVLLAIGSYRLTSRMADYGKDIIQRVTEGEVNHNQDHSEPYRQYSRIFNDLNEVQLDAARRNGLKKFLNREQIEASNELVQISTCDYYHIQKLTHSVPYLVPKAAQLLEDMGRAFQDSLFNRGYSRNHKFIVTSVLRTPESVRELQKSNVNSTTNSAHCYGTTIDISYYHFKAPETGKIASEQKMEQVLMQVAYDMHRQNRCYIKYEKQQACLHITVR